MVMQSETSSVLPGEIILMIFETAVSCKISGVFAPIGLCCKTLYSYYNDRIDDILANMTMYRKEKVHNDFGKKIGAKNRWVLPNGKFHGLYYCNTESSYEHCRAYRSDGAYDETRKMVKKRNYYKGKVHGLCYYHYSVTNDFKDKYEILASFKNGKRHGTAYELDQKLEHYRLTITQWFYNFEIHSERLSKPIRLPYFYYNSNTINKKIERKTNSGSQEEVYELINMPDTVKDEYWNERVGEFKAVRKTIKSQKNRF